MAAPQIVSSTLPPHGTSGIGGNGWVVAEQPVSDVEFSAYGGPSEFVWASTLSVAGGTLKVGDATPDGTLLEVDVELASAPGASLTEGSFAAWVRVQNEAGEWSAPALLLFEVYVDQIATSLLPIEVEIAPGVFAQPGSGISNNAPQATEASGLTTLRLSTVAIDRGGGQYSAAVRIGGPSGTVHEGPLSGSTAEWTALVRADSTGQVQWVAWADGVLGVDGQDALGRVIATPNGRTLYNADKSVAFTTPTRSVALLDAAGIWVWVQSFSGVGATITAAISSSGVVAALGLPASTTSFASADGTWSYTKPNTNAGVMVVWLDAASGSVDWSEPVLTSRSETLRYSLSLSPEGRVAGFVRHNAASGTATFSFDTVSTTGPTVCGFVFSCGPYTLNPWGGPGPSRAQWGGTWVSAQDDIVYLAHEAGFASGTWTSDWGPYSLTGSTRPTLVGAIAAADGSLLWYQQPIVGDAAYSLVYSRLLGSTQAGAWVSQNTSITSTLRVNDIAFVGPDGSVVASLRQETLGSGSSHASLAPTSEVNAYAVIYQGGPVTLLDGDGSAAESSVPAGQYFAAVSAAGGGVWNEIAGSGLPDAITPPASSDWPGTVNEDTIISSTVEGADLRDPAVEGADVVLQVLDPATGVWGEPTTEEPLELAGGFGPGSYGNAVVSVSQGSTAEFLLASVTVIPDLNYNGDVRVFTRWFDRSTGASSAVTRFVTIVAPLPDAPSAPDGEMPETVEDVASVGIFTTDDPDATGTYTWQLSPQTQEPEGWDSEVDGDFHTIVGSSVSVSVDDLPAGTASVASQDDTVPSAAFGFMPASNWHGTARFDARVSNGAEWSPWVTVTVTVTPVADAPSAVVGEAPDTPEDTPAEFTLTWSDPDDLDLDHTAAATGYSLELGLSASGPWTALEDLDVGGATIRVLSYSETALAATLRTEPTANFHGLYAVAVRVIDPDGNAGPARLLTGTITSVDDAPARVTPARMPAASSGQTVVGTFTTSDPDTDNTSWTFTIASTAAGPWGSSLVVPSVGTLTVLDADLTDFRGDVRLEQQAGGATLTRYRFFIRATDSTGLSSPVTEVIGYVAPPQAGGWLQRLDRSESAATVVRLCPLVGLRRLSVTESLTGPGSAELTVNAAEVRQRAADLNMSPAELLEAGAREFSVVVGGEPVWVGPITEVRWDAGSDIVAISARGLMSYLESRVLPAETGYVTTDLGVIVADLVADTQAASWGALAIADGTVAVGSSTTVTFPAGERLTDVLRALGDEEVDAPEVWVDADRILRTAVARGADQRSKVRITSGMCEVASWTTRDDDLATVVTVVAPDGISGTYVDSAGVAVYGRVERVVDADYLLTVEACETLAERIAKARAVRIETLRLRVSVGSGRPFSVSDVGVGDVVTVDLRDPQLGQVLGSYRIVGRTLELAAAGAEALVATLDLESSRYVDGRLVGSRTRHVPEVMARLTEVAALRR